MSEDQFFPQDPLDGWLEPDAAGMRGRLDFVIGLAGSLVGNFLLLPVLFYLLIALSEQITGKYGQLISILIFLVIPTLFNLAALFLPLLFHRPKFSLGVLVTFVAVLALALVGGILYQAACTFVGNL